MVRWGQGLTGTFSRVRSIGTFLITSVAVTLSLGLLLSVAADKADAAVYRAERGGLLVMMVTQRGQLRQIETRYRLRCSDGNTRRVSRFLWSNLQESIPVDRSTGRFFGRSRSTIGSRRLITEIGGQLGRAGITGFLSERRTPWPPALLPGCATRGEGGRLRIGFVARRLGSPEARA